jgi:hypothetical protein
MRWLKHMTATRDDEKVAALIDRLGYEGYGLWWAVLETIAASMEKGSEKCSLRYPISKWAAELQLHPPNVCRQLADLCAEGLLAMSRSDAGIELTAPNLLKYRDEYAQRSGQSPDTLPTKKQSQNTDTDKQHTASPNGSWKSACFEEFWTRCVWVKIAKGKAREAYFRRAKTADLAERINQAAKDQGPGLVADAERQGRTVLHPTTWLNGERWDDEPALFPEVEREIM